MNKKEQAITIAIVGLGPRGLSIFERLIANADEFARSEELEINVHLFDPHKAGSGSHVTEQPEYLLVNTVASQITQFSDPSIQNAGPVLPGPSFYEWLVNNRVNTTQELSPNGYYSRALFGEYLHWVFNYLLELCPDFFNIFHHEKMVEDISEKVDGSWTLHTRETTVDADFIYLTTGHTRRKPSQSEEEESLELVKMRELNPRIDIIHNPYPIVDQLKNINQLSSVAIEGAGLTTCDIVAELTVGRGGHFLTLDGNYTYFPSGNEPSNILIISRSGVPLSARAINQKGVDGQYKPKFITFENIQLLKIQHGKLDFEKHIFPLLYREMSYVYYMTLIMNQDGKARAEQFSEKFTSVIDTTLQDEIINQFIDEEHHFNWGKLLNPVPENITQKIFMDWLYQHLKTDVENALQGNVGNPLKAACDVLRDVRDILRNGIDFSSLTEASHLKFIREFVPLMNRLAVGPPYTRILEWIALMEAGIIQFNLGPLPSCQLDTKKAQFTFISTAFHSAPVHVDVLIKARVEMPSPRDDESPLMQNMLNKQFIKLFKNENYHPGGIEVNPNLNIIRSTGEIVNNIWALGILTEGCKFYTFVVPRPGVNSTFVVDAGRAIRQMITQILRKKATQDSDVFLVRQPAELGNS